MPDHDLDDPQYARFAWGRFRRLMLWMVGVSLLATMVGIYVLHQMIGELPIHMIIAAGLGVFFAVLLAALLMGLVFLSAGSGHDDKIADPFKDRNP